MKITINDGTYLGKLKLRGGDFEPSFAYLYKDNVGVYAENGEPEIVFLSYKKVSGINTTRSWDTNDKACASFSVRLIPSDLVSLAINMTP